jgi:hypothetical protein
MTDEMNKISPVEADQGDPLLQSALSDFRASVHAWSDAAYNRPRPALSSAQSFAWRRVAAWVLSLALSFGIIGTAAYDRHHRRVVAEEQQRQQQEMEQRQRAQAEQQARATQNTSEAEDALMANIESAVSRQVPSAMEPLTLTTDEIQ